MKINKGIISLILFVVFVAGITAQSATYQEAEIRISNDETLARNMERLVQETDYLRDMLYHQQTWNNATSNFNRVEDQWRTSQAGWRTFFSNGGELTPEQNSRIWAIHSRIHQANAQIARNLQGYR